MELKELLDGIAVFDTNANTDYEVSGIEISSDRVQYRNLFFCMEGVRDDGNRYIGDIGCDFIAVTEKKPEGDVKYVLVPDVRKAYSLICQNWFRRPAEGMKFIAVIGTNGKTSTAHYISSLLTFAGYKVGLIGTEGHYILGEKVSESLTTPDPYELNELLFKMRAKGVDAVVSEVSAHAIYLEKLYGIKSDLALLTNITQDHLDFFDTFANYCGVKMSYFTAENTKKAIINMDDPSGRILIDRLEKSGLPHLSYGLKNPADCFCIDVTENIDGVKFVANLCDEIIEVRSGLYGEFNVYNLLLALSACRELGVPAETLAYGVRKIKAVKGRFSILNNDRGTIIIDYAHTPDGLKNLLTTARTLTKSRLITLFGCGGERDRDKRAKMGRVAAELSDFVVLTSDNPRFEDPESILADIESGTGALPADAKKTIADRTEAIRYATGEMLEGDTLVIAGKGNENYLDIRGKRIPYNDFDTVARWGRLK